MKIVIVSGVSGSGKSTFIRALEDIGFFCIDNFPIILMEEFIKICKNYEDRLSKIAVVVDIREREFFDKSEEIIKELKETYRAECVFLESSDSVLIRRFNETRRMHPILEYTNVKDALKKEREAIEWLKNLSNRVIDTSQLSTHELRKIAMELYGEGKREIKITLMSFGYSYGIPVEADMIFDVRFLPNPYYVEELRNKTGLSEEVGMYIKSNDVYKRYFLLLSDLLEYLIPLFEQEGKSYLTICIGCTGGKHRSVFVVKELEDLLISLGYNILTVHRDINR